MVERCYDPHDRTYWYVGDREVFRLSKDNCQKFLRALVMCGARIHDCLSTCSHNGKMTYDVRPHQMDACFALNLPRGLEKNFEEAAGFPLEEPIKIHCNNSGDDAC
jgi:hypothetical protein